MTQSKDTIIVTSNPKTNTIVKIQYNGVPYLYSIISSSSFTYNGIPSINIFRLGLTCELSSDEYQSMKSIIYCIYTKEHSDLFRLDREYDFREFFYLIKSRLDIELIQSLEFSVLKGKLTHLIATLVPCMTEYLASVSKHSTFYFDDSERMINQSR